MTPAKLFDDDEPTSTTRAARRRNPANFAGQSGAAAQQQARRKPATESEQVERAVEALITANSDQFNALHELLHAHAWKPQQGEAISDLYTISRALSERLGTMLKYREAFMAGLITSDSPR